MAGWDRATRTRRAARQVITNNREAGKATFLVPHTWPDIRNAEYEVLKRLAIAAENIGSTMIAVDNDGLPLWASRKMYLDNPDRIKNAIVQLIMGSGKSKVLLPLRV